MPHSLGACIDIEMRAKLRSCHMVRVREKIYQRLLVVCDNAADLDPVAG
jgi:hypothetical protein